MEASAPSEPQLAPESPPRLNDAGVPGRTRPRFEELAPGPPTWPGWVAVAIACAVLLVAGAIAVIGGTDQSPASALILAASLLGGAALLLAGLVWIPIAGILRRRILPDDRYRGGSVIALFLLALIGGSILSAPILLALSHWDAGVLANPPPSLITFELLVTPLCLLGVLVIFVALPRALPRLRLWQGMASVRWLLVGCALGIVTWVGITVAAALVEALLSRLGVQLEGQQDVIGLAQKVSPVVAVLTIAVLAPIAEELFFRGLVFNAWEREYGTRRAVLGSALLFSTAHALGGGGAPTLVITFVLGLILALVFAGTRTITTTIGLHAFFNLTTLALIFAGVQ